MTVNSALKPDRADLCTAASSRIFAEASESFALRRMHNSATAGRMPMKNR
jgi:hypothetical protein